MSMNYESCTLCPRMCGADRTKASGFCGASHQIKAARAALHQWEEPCISGTAGQRDRILFRLYPKMRFLPELSSEP